MRLYSCVFANMSNFGARIDSILKGEQSGKGLSKIYMELHKLYYQVKESDEKSPYRAILLDHMERIRGTISEQLGGIVYLFPHKIVSETLIGMDDIIEDIENEIIAAMNGSYLGGSVSRLVLRLYWGVSGTGKTTLALEIARRFEMFMLNVRCSELVSKFVGDSEKALTKVLEYGINNTPVVILMDELDGIFKERAGSSHPDSLSKTFQSFISMNEGTYAKTSEDFVVIIGTTNYPESFDVAFKRRWKAVEIKLPDADGRLVLFRHFIHKFSVNRVDPDPSENTEEYVQETVDKSHNFSVHDIKTLVMRIAKSKVIEAGRKRDDRRIREGDTVEAVTWKELAESVASYKRSVDDTTIEAARRQAEVL